MDKKIARLLLNRKKLVEMVHTPVIPAVVGSIK
jgi:hypothetical protein